MAIVASKQQTQLRRLTAGDLEAVIAIDAQATGGRSRRAYIERRLEAAIADPALHVQFGVEDEGRLAGFALARKLAGEFGRADPALRLEMIGVRADEQGHGIGDWLMTGLTRWAREHGIRELRTQASWRDHRMLRFLDHAGFKLGRNQVIEAEVHAGALGETDTVTIDTATEIDYSQPLPNDFELLERDTAHIRSLEAADTDGVIRIDRRLAGRDRGDYIRQAVKEALGRSGVRVSLAVEVDGAVAGFVMAKTDFGDFGRTEPVAVIDTIGVDPERGRQGLGRALLSQLFVNLKALGVEHVETVVARENFGLLGFLYRVGFGASDRIAFVKGI